MFDRMPLAEVNFLGIVMAIQSKTGGNLAEALNNLSKVLRDRKKMKPKIAAVSQEAKSSAADHRLAAVRHHGRHDACSIRNISTRCGIRRSATCWSPARLIWMGTGVLIMRKMINFDF